MTAALIVVDVQNGFCDDFSPAELPVAGGAVVASRIASFVRNERGRFATVVATKDYHVDPGRHFESAERPADFVEVWPVHCRAGTNGADFHQAIALLEGEGLIDAVFYKGLRAPAYSGFEGTDTPEGDGIPLGRWLREQGVVSVVICGIATSHCVKETALSALAEGFSVAVPADLCTGVTDDAAVAALAALELAGATVASVL